jgi:hypothetical protein
LLYEDNEKRGYWQIVKIVLFCPDKVPDIVLPDSLVIDNNNSSPIQVSVAINDNNEVLQDASRYSGVGFSEKDIEHSMESNSQSSTTSIEIMRHNELIHVEENNERFYMDSSGFRRTGQNEGKQNAMHNASASIESPHGFVSDYSGSIVS